MKKAEIRIGATYLVKLGSRNTIHARIVGIYGNGWYAVNVKNGRTIRIPTTRRILQEVRQEQVKIREENQKS